MAAAAHANITRRLSLLVLMVMQCSACGGTHCCSPRPHINILCLLTHSALKQVQQTRSESKPKQEGHHYVLRGWGRWMFKASCSLTQLDTYVPDKKIRWTAQLHDVHNFQCYTCSADFADTPTFFGFELASPANVLGLKWTKTSAPRVPAKVASESWHRRITPN